MVNIQRNRPRDKSREDKRKKSLIYSFLVNNEKITICRTMYLHTLSISEQFIKTAQSKDGSSGLVINDQRGKHEPVNKCPQIIIDSIKTHIEKYPAYISHYSREKTEEKI